MTRRRLRWDEPKAGRQMPKRPYRDTALVYGGMALVVVVIAVLTGGNVVNAVVIALVFFIAATLWTWRTWRNRLRDENSRGRR